MIELHITLTGKSYSPKANWQTIGFDRQVFDTVGDAKEFLRERYGKCKRVAMYREVEPDYSVQTGWIYCYRNADWSHAPVEKWLSQDWCELHESQPLPVE